MAEAASEPLVLPAPRRAWAPGEGVHRALILGAMAAPLAVIRGLPPRSPDSAIAWMIAVAMAVLGTARLIAGRAADPSLAPGPGAPRMLSTSDVPAPIAAAMHVRVALAEHGRLDLRGPLAVPPEGLVERLERELPGAAVRLEEDPALGARLSIAPAAARSRVRRAAGALGSHAVAGVLFVATLAVTTFIGTVARGADPLSDPKRLALGLPYSIVLLLVMLAHALGRSLALSRHGEDVPPPYFLPVPVMPGTLGAHVASRPRSRAALADGALAGTAAALLVGVPLLYAGLRVSPVVVPPATTVSGVPVGASILLAMVARLACGGGLAYGDRLLMTPAAAGAWLALMVLALRLVPGGALDGGALIRALFGHRAGTRVGRALGWGLVVLAALVRPGVLPWVVLVLLAARRPAVPADDVTPLPAGRRVLAALAFAVFALIVTPLPDALHGAAGIHERTPEGPVQTVGL